MTTGLKLTLIGAGLVGLAHLFHLSPRLTPLDAVVAIIGAVVVGYGVYRITRE